uniref:hypothetical protein n=1 Tax=Aeromonas TaxID=642 RepID=UPI0015E8579E|nr:MULTISPECIES: hypothetical protein [Aeromonas]
MILYYLVTKLYSTHSLDHWVKACNIAANVGQIQAFRVLLKEATDQGKPLAWPHGGNHVIIGRRLN